VRAWQCSVDFADEILEISFHLFPRIIAELFHARQNLDGNHLAAIHFVLFHEAVAKFGVFVERLLDALGADVLAIREDDEVLDAAHDIHVAIFVEANEVAGFDPAVGREGFGGFFGFTVVAEENVVATEPQFAINYLSFLFWIEFTDRCGSGFHVNVAGGKVGTFGHAISAEEVDAQFVKFSDEFRGYVGCT